MVMLLCSAQEPTFIPRPLVADEKQGNNVTAERLLSRLAAVILALVISPVVGLLSGIAWFEAGGKDSGGIAGFIVGIAVFALLVWKAGSLLQKAFDSARAGLPEPIASSLLFGVVGAVLLGGGVAASILLLGHTRPVGWDFDRIPLWMGVGFMIFAVAGFVVGRRKRRAIR
jgi:hypothetical protein